jgi:hypothetical protein
MEDSCILLSDVATAVIRLRRRVPGDNHEWQEGKRIEKKTSFTGPRIITFLYLGF